MQLNLLCFFFFFLLFSKNEDGYNAKWPFGPPVAKHHQFWCLLRIFTILLFYCCCSTVVLLLFYYCFVVLLFYYCFTIVVLSFYCDYAFFAPCFLCPQFKIKQLCPHLPCPCLISGPESRVLLPSTLCLGVLASSCSTTAVWLNNGYYYFTFFLQFASATSSGNFRTRLHKHIGKDSRERETVLRFIPSVILKKWYLQACLDSVLLMAIAASYMEPPKTLSWKLILWLQLFVLN